MFLKTSAMLSEILDRLQTMETHGAIDEPKLLEKHASADIFIVDDEKIVVETLKYYLKSAGFKRVRGYTDSTKALAKMRLIRPDLVFTDVQMPDLSGNAMAKLIRCFPQLRHVPIIAITSDHTIKTRNEMLKNGAESVLLKPIARDVLIEQTIQAIDNTFSKTTPDLIRNRTSNSSLMKRILLQMPILSPYLRKLQKNAV